MSEIYSFPFLMNRNDYLNSVKINTILDYQYLYCISLIIATVYLIQRSGNQYKCMS